MPETPPELPPAPTPETPASPETLRVDAAGDGARLDRFLRRRFPSLPQGLLQRLTREKTVTVNGRKAEPGSRLASGDTVELGVDLSEHARASGKAIEGARKVRESAGFRRNFRIVHEDESLIVLDKPGGLVVHPGPEHHRGDTLLDLLRAHLPERFSRNSPFRPAFVHRLDRGTSGVIIAAKTREAARALEEALRGGKARKAYLALAHGKLFRNEGTITKDIGKTVTASGVTRWRAIPRRDLDEERGRMAVTRYRVERRFGKSSLLRVEIGTGRTHQIRVHLASIGCPLVGDGDYGDRRTNTLFRERYGLRRLFLHAAEISIPHPADGALRTFRSPLPPDLEGVLKALKALGGE